MRRREILAGIAGLVVAQTARGQTARAPRKIGYLHPRTVDPDFPTLAVLRPVWRRLG